MMRLVRWVTWIGLVISAGLLAASLLATIASLFPAFAPVYPKLLWLFVGIFILVAPSWFISYHNPELTRLRAGRWFVDRGSKRGQAITTALTSHAPKWAQWVTTVIWIYVILTVIIVVIFPEPRGGPVTAGLVRSFSAFDMALYSNFWLLFWSRLRLFDIPDEQSAGEPA